MYHMVVVWSVEIAASSSFTHLLFYVRLGGTLIWDTPALVFSSLEQVDVQTNIKIKAKERMVTEE